MLEVLQGLIQQHGQEAVVNNPAVPNSQNNAVMQEVMSGILGGMGNQAASNGGIGSLLGMLGGGGNAGMGSNPIVGAISQQVVGNLMQKFGLSNSAASGVVASMIPAVLGSLMSKANDPNDSSVDAGSIGNLIGLLGGGNQQQAGGMGGLGNILSGIFGK
jgi:Bacterial protein of unknown function (DUF937)